MAVIKQSEINAARKLTNALGQYSVIQTNTARIVVQHDVAPQTVRQVLAIVNAWCVSLDSHVMHYGIEAIKRGTCAVLDAPSSIDLDAPIS